MTRKLNIAKDRLLPAQAYREKFLQELTDSKLLDFFDSEKRARNLMLWFYGGQEAEGTREEIPKEYVPGCAWPGNYGRVDITDYRKYMTTKGRKKIVLPNGDTEYQDWEGQKDLVPYALPTTAQNIAAEVERKRTSYYSFPHWVGEKYKERLLVRIQGRLAQGSTLTEEMLAEVLADLTPFERSKYEQSLYNIDVALYPSVEQPVRVRIDGIDDGAEEALFADEASALAAIEEIACWNDYDRRRRHGFRHTD